MAVTDIPSELQGKTPEELRDIVEFLDAQLKSMHQTEAGEIRSLDEEEQSAFDAGMALREKAIEMVDEHHRIAEVFRRRPAAVEQALFHIQNRDSSDVTRMTNHEVRSAALRCLDDRESTAHLDDASKVQVAQVIRRDPRLARRILVTENDDYRSAWLKLVTEAQPMLDPDEVRAVRAYQEYRAMNITTDTAGGFGVPVFIDPSIIMTAQGSGNPFLEIARQEPIQTDTWKGVSSAGVSWSFDTEATAVSDDAPTLAQPTVPVFTARGFIPYSIEIGQDYPSFAEEMGRLLAEGYDELLVEKFSTGNGTTEPQGVLTGATTLTTVGTDGAFSAPDVYAAYAELPQRFRRNASWMMSVDVNNRIRQMGTGDLNTQTVNLTAEWAEVVLGKRVYENPYFPDFTGTTGAANIAVVGDFSAYLIARRAGMSVELVPHLFDVTTNRPTGQRGWFAWSRIGGGVVNVAAFRKLANT